MGKRVVGSLSTANHIYPGPPPSLLLKNNVEKEKKWYTLSGFLQCYYIPFLTIPLTKVSQILINIINDTIYQKNFVI